MGSWEATAGWKGRADWGVIVAVDIMTGSQLMADTQVAAILQERPAESICICREEQQGRYTKSFQKGVESADDSAGAFLIRCEKVG